MSMWISLNQELIEQERRERDAEILAIYRQRRALELAGYEPAGARLRARAAGWLLRLAVLLDKRVAEAGPQVAALRVAQR